MEQRKHEARQKSDTPKGNIGKQILQYLFLKKRDKDEPRGIDLSLMHGMNRISILIFLAAIIILVARAILRN